MGWLGGACGLSRVGDRSHQAGGGPNPGPSAHAVRLAPPSTCKRQSPHFPGTQDVFHPVLSVLHRVLHLSQQQPCEVRTGSIPISICSEETAAREVKQVAQSHTASHRATDRGGELRQWWSPRSLPHGSGGFLLRAQDKPTLLPLQSHLI